MIVRNNVPIYDICWLNYAEGGVIGTLYEPENIDELCNICSTLYQEGKGFDLIGHTSNIYFLPNYNIEFMVSTRRCNNYHLSEEIIECDCGVHVSKLAHQMVEKGLKGFEGLIDLPGTIGAAVYGNASCYGCSINSLLLSFKLLKPSGETITMYPNDLKLSKRSSSLKRQEIEGVILSIQLKKEQGNIDSLKRIAEKNHQIRKATQPTPKDNLGSIYASTHKKTIIGFLLKVIVKICGLVYCIRLKSKSVIKDKEKRILLTILGAKVLIPYIYDWNRFIWKNKHAHTLFWKYDKLHRLLFKESVFEIEIKGKI